MRSIKVNWDSVEIAFERNAPDLHSYIDRDTGEVLVVMDRLPEDADKRRSIAESPDQFVKIDPASSREQYRWMERFVASVQEPQLRERLLIAIDGKGAFRRFKDVLLSYPSERERWFNYRANLLHHHINQWFASKALEADPLAPWGEVTLPPEPPDLAERLPAPGQGPADMLRIQVKGLVDTLPACELHSARSFLEYLRDRGSADLVQADGRSSFRSDADLEPDSYREPDGTDSASTSDRDQDEELDLSLASSGPLLPNG